MINRSIEGVADARPVIQVKYSHQTKLGCFLKTLALDVIKLANG